MMSATLVKDIQVDAAGSAPDYLTNINGTLFFSADDGVHGAELWKSTGTTAGTVIVKDINPGIMGSSPHALYNFNGKLLFSAEATSLNRELWISDGTAAGTVMLKDIRTGGSSYPYDFTERNGIVYFSAYELVPGGFDNELWRTDGTAVGTYRVKDINPGSPSSNPKYLTNVDGTLYFRADDGVNGTELWKSDGTAAGTMLVKDINPGMYGSYLYNLTGFNGRLYFQANDSVHGAELWTSDGMADGTVMVQDINPAGDANPWYLTASGGSLFFQATDGTSGLELWTTDGTTTGRVADILAGPNGSRPKYLTNANGTLYFQANNGATGAELWKSDGTVGGTVLVKDIQVGSLASSPKNFSAVGGGVYFQADDGLTGPELWYSNGDPGGPLRVADIRIGDSGSSPAAITNVNGTVFFRADDGVNGVELWRTIADAQVIGQSVFYNRSQFDGNDPAASASDDAAIAVDKQALLPGQLATFANYTSYSRGINGLMIDVAALPGIPTASDFDFRVGNDNTPSNWADAPAAQSITVRPGAGTDGSSRITIMWPDDAIKNQWLQVTVKATAATGLSQPFNFYFGNAVGEGGNSSTDAVVNGTDEILARQNPKTFLAPATVSDVYDFNRDGFVNAVDQILARSNSTTLTTALQLISPPAGVQALAVSISDLPATESTAITPSQPSWSAAKERLAHSFAIAQLAPYRTVRATALSAELLPTPRRAYAARLEELLWLPGGIDPILCNNSIAWLKTAKQRTQQP